VPNWRIIYLSTIALTSSTLSGISTLPLSRLVANLVSKRNPDFSRKEDIVIVALIYRSKRCSVTCCISAFISSVSLMSTSCQPSIRCTFGIAPSFGSSVALLIRFQIDFCSSCLIVLKILLYCSLSPLSCAWMRQLRKCIFLKSCA
jgi:hypothetical protein